MKQPLIIFGSGLLDPDSKTIISANVGRVGHQLYCMSDNFFSQNAFQQVAARRREVAAVISDCPTELIAIRALGVIVVGMTTQFMDPAIIGRMLNVGIPVATDVVSAANTVLISLKRF